VVDGIAELSGTAISVQADVSSSAEVHRMIASVIEDLGRIDYVTHNAGEGRIADLERLDEEMFDQTLRINLLSDFLVSQAAIPHMKERGGRLIFMSSGPARTGGKISAAYAASKAGLEGLMHYYAMYLLPHRITANAIAPSMIESDMVRKMQFPPFKAMPLGRLVLLCYKCGAPQKGQRLCYQEPQGIQPIYVLSLTRLL
jgi:3-oxoacyl-[acyl-carrier protein] reductase